ncbi:polysaccharide deacetylase family protein [Aureispira anguillae]|uniref:Polysaccharide deacetylase family protein n=1 Tax=Aureispira anguillae TaxID=2864201 RepID=A0A915VJT5_9BACT|nr:polysaccharide deacetylase family protein [Aureispira anguillae]BDS09336.1 polysaccharide deacetylase family protein [Aureispira anguillae]
MNELFIYTPVSSPRISYIFDLIFNQILGIPKVNLTSDLYAFVQLSGVAKINYSRSYISDIPHFYPHKLLQETSIDKKLKPIFKKHQDLNAAFFHIPTEKNNKAALPFDPFALSFYLVSRYEEYLPFTADQYGRFSATSSVAYKNRFLQQPLINFWALAIKKLLIHQYPQLNSYPPQYQYTATYDIDYAYAFLQKGFFRQIGAFGRNLLQRDKETLMLQLKTWFRLQKDPYDTFDYLQELDRKFDLSPIYFWLIGDYGTYDKNIHYNNRHFRQLIQKNAQNYRTGIHPSFGSQKHQDLVDKEINRLEKVTQKRTTRSRQHFLMLQFPQTYQRLVNLSIQEDYSMGYARHLGFRASIATPFFWYDLEAEKATNLLIFPFQLMDVTFNSYLKLSPEQVLEQALPVINNTKKVGGHLISIWHNSSLCEAWQWKQWRTVYEHIIVAASPKTK